MGLHTIDQTVAVLVQAPDKLLFLKHIKYPLTGAYGHVTNRKVQRETLKYVLLAHDLFHQTIDGLLLKWLGSDQSKIAMGEVHVEICSTHWLAYMR
jgi:hypothetical protein